MSPKAMAGLIAAGIVLIIFSNSFYIVDERQRAVLLRFGEVVNSDISTGWHFKMPMVNNVRKFDARVLTLDAKPERFLTKEKKAVIVDSFVKWRVANVKDFYTSASGDEFIAARLLAQRINTGLRNEFGARTLHEVVSGERDQLMHNLTVAIDKVTRAELGIEVLDIRVKRIDLPQEVSQSVYSRMNTGREREAREHRSQGKEQAEIIRSSADREVTVLKANAYRESEQLRGDGDAEAAAIYAKAYNRDAEFYSFYRSLNAYKKTFSNKGDVMVIDPNSDFFKYFNDPNGVN